MPKCNCNSILIVDDDIFNLRALDSLLNRLGFKALMAKNGKEAVEIFIEKMIN